MLSKSIGWDGIAFRDNTVSSRSSLSPDPAAANVVVVEDSPKIVLSSLGLLPVPRFLEFEDGTVHLLHVETVSESGELGISSEVVLAESGSGKVAIDFKSTNGVSQSDDASSPAFIERLVGISIGSSSSSSSILEVGGGIERVIGTVEFHVVDYTGDWQLHCAGNVSFVGIAAITRHPSNIAVFLFRPDCGFEGEPLLG